MKMTVTSALVLALLQGLQLVSKPQTDSPTEAVSVSTANGDHVVLELHVDDRAARDVAAVGALAVKVDGQESQFILMTPGTGRTTYDALIGPLTAGVHRITLERSTLWPWPDGLGVASVPPRVVTAGSSDSIVLAHTPTMGVRADTIGTASDTPLVLYVEDDRRDGRGWIRYSVIISHEDGGTPAPALMARWGRTTDIELIYEVEMDGTRLVQDRFQGPDHEVRAFAGPREGQHPVLLIATLNNMFIDRGKSLASMRPVPQIVNLDRRTRESVMDDNPWIYPLMARELVAEKRIGTQIEDPREFLYVEAGLESRERGGEREGWLRRRRLEGLDARPRRSRGQPQRLGAHRGPRAVSRRLAEMGMPGAAKRTGRFRGSLRDRVGTGVPAGPGLPARREPDLARQGSVWCWPQRRGAPEGPVGSFRSVAAASATAVSAPVAAASALSQLSPLSTLSLLAAPQSTAARSFLMRPPITVELLGVSDGRPGPVLQTLVCSSISQPM